MGHFCADSKSDLCVVILVVNYIKELRKHTNLNRNKSPYKLIDEGLFILWLGNPSLRISAFNQPSCFSVFISAAPLKITSDTSFIQSGVRFYDRCQSMSNILSQKNFEG